MALRHKEIKMLINCLYETIFRHFYILLDGIHDLLLSAVNRHFIHFTAQHLWTLGSADEPCGHSGPWSWDQGQLLLTSGPWPYTIHCVPGHWYDATNDSGSVDTW